MIKEKRIRKSPEVFIPYNPKLEKKEKPIEKKQKFSRCEFRVFSLPLKYNHMNDTLLLHGVVSSSPFLFKKINTINCLQRFLVANFF